MKKIWKVSKEPSNWQMQDASPLLNWWWALWLIAIFISNFSFSTTMESTIVAIITGSIKIILTVVSISLVSNIYNMQERLIKGVNV
jgi:hypothetical protein